MTNAEALAAYEAAEADLKQAQHAWTVAYNAVLTFQRKHGYSPTDPHLQATAKQLKALQKAAGETMDTATHRLNKLLATVPQPHSPKRWYQPSVPNTED